MKCNLAIKALQQCAKTVQSLQYNIRPLSCNKKPENKLHLLKLTCFLLIQETRRSRINFSTTLTKIDVDYIKTNIDILETFLL